MRRPNPDHRSTTLRRALAAAAGVFLLAAGSGSPHAQDRAPGSSIAQPRLPVVRIQAGIHVIKAERAATPREREIGLMGRERLGPNEGMLFVFETRGMHCFWMRNTPLPLSIAFLDDDGRIVHIAQMAPHSERSHCPVKPVRFALEMEQGWFARHGLATGARLMQPELFPGPR